MRQPTDLPSDKGPRLITTYKRLQAHINSWADPSPKETPRLLIVGPPGTGKSFAYEELAQPLHIFQGRSSAYAIYNQVKEDPDRPAVFDDISTLLRDKPSLDLMKQMLHGREHRIIRWTTGQGDSFVYSGKVLVIANELPTTHPDLLAIFSRCDNIRFVPTKSEIMSVMERIVGNDRVGLRALELIRQADALPDLRALGLVIGWLNSKHLDAMEEFCSQYGVPQNIRWMIQVLENNPKKGQRHQEYANLCGKDLEAARREWSRYVKTAQEILDARKTTATSESSVLLSR